MKNLLIMRHAKSDWGSSSMSDFERPLNKRGFASAPLMGRELINKKRIPELIISSPALRAKTTAELLASVIDYNRAIQFEKNFYFGYIDEIIQLVRKTDNSLRSIMIVGHNPTLEYLLEELLIQQVAYSFPTAAIASINFEIEKWEAVSKNSGTLEWLIVPKEIAV
jgi:phosphohistidine phosphatase